MAHRENEAGVVSSHSAAALPGMTPVERASGRYMRAPDHDEGGDIVDPQARIAALLADDSRFDDDLPIDGDEDIDAGDGEQDAPGADEAEGQDAESDGEQEAPAIAPPVSWKAEHKEAFAALPTELQQVVADREAERERAFQAKSQEAANARQTAWNEARQVAEQQLAEVAAQLEQQVGRFIAAPLPSAPDPALIDDDPQEFLRQQARYDQAIAQRVEAQQQAAYLRQVQEQQAQQALQQQAAVDHRTLAERLPEWADDAKRPVIARAIATFANDHGFADRLESADATDVLFLHEAMGWKDKAAKWDAYQGSKMQAVRAAKELPRVARPNAAQPPGSAQAKGFHQQRDALRATGRVDDAARLIRNFIK